MQSSLLYGLTVIALIAIILFFYRRMAVRHPNTVVVPSVPIIPVWPWELTAYSYWPYWLSGGGGGSASASGGYSGSTHGSGLRPWGGAGRSANGLHSVSHGSGGHGSGGHGSGGHGAGSSHR